MAVKAVRQGDGNKEVFEQHKAEIPLRRAVHAVMQVGFGERDALNQRVAVSLPLLLQAMVPFGDKVSFFANFPNGHFRLPG